MKSSGWALLGLTLVCITCQAETVWSEFRLTPSITVREEYNDNLYLTRSHREDDFITTINPAFAMRYESKALNVTLDYGLNFRLYADHSEENETSLRETQRARLDARISPYRDVIFIRVTDEYRRVPIESRRQVAQDNYISNMTDLNHLTVNPYIELPLGKATRFNAGYRYENLSYRSNLGDDTTNHLFTTGLSHELSSRLSAMISYGYLLHRPDLTEDYDRHNADIGITWRPNPRVTLGGTVGKVWFDYDSGRESNSSTWNITADYQINQLLALRAGYSQSFADSVNVGTYKRERAEASVIHTGKIPVQLTVFEFNDKYISENRKDETTGITLTTRAPITPKLSANLTGSYMTSESSVPDEAVTREEYDRYSVGIELAYEFRITTLSIGYTWNWSDSSIDSNDYKNNIVWIQARFSF